MKAWGCQGLVCRCNYKALPAYVLLFHISLYICLHADAAIRISAGYLCVCVLCVLCIMSLSSAGFSSLWCSEAHRPSKDGNHSSAYSFRQREAPYEDYADALAETSMIHLNQWKLYISISIFMPSYDSKALRVSVFDETQKKTFKYWCEPNNVRHYSAYQQVRTLWVCRKHFRWCIS